MLNHVGRFESSNLGGTRHSANRALLAAPRISVA
jgi:hypothetical protein